MVCFPAWRIDQLLAADGSPTFFRYNLDGSQWMSGLGSYIFEKKYKKIMTLAEDGLCSAPRTGSARENETLGYWRLGL